MSEDTNKALLVYARTITVLLAIIVALAVIKMCPGYHAWKKSMKCASKCAGKSWDKKSCALSKKKDCEPCAKGEPCAKCSKGSKGSHSH